ncbi:MAG: CheR family methyltransferase [bacterium]
MFKNIMDDLVSDYLQTYLINKYDVCSCDLCKKDIMAYALSRLPAKYVTTDVGAMKTVIEQTRSENESEIIKRIIEAIEVVSKTPRHEVKHNIEQAFHLLLNNLFVERGIDFTRYQRGILKRRIATRMSANGVKSYADYLRFLVTNPEEYNKIFDALTINISEFFRDPDVFSELRNVISEMIAEKRENNDYVIRMWSAGCSKGQEAFSVVILLNEILGADISRFDIEVRGTDIDKKCLEHAKVGKYHKDSLKNVNKELLQKYFIPAGKEHYIVTPEIRKVVKFEYHNLVGDPYPENLDFILCRNVFIFLSRSLQEQLISSYLKALSRGGYLVLGAVEILLGEARACFVEVSSTNRIYRKK